MSKFAKRHYEFVASIIKQTRADLAKAGLDTPAHRQALDKIAWNYADSFASENIKFDVDRFFNATVDGVVKRPRSS